MDLVFETAPAFLRNTLASTRLALVGCNRFESMSAEPIVTLQFNFKSQNETVKSVLLELVKGFLVLVMVFSMMVSAVLLVPSLYYRFFPADTVPVQTLQSGTPLGGSFEAGTLPKAPIQVLPPQDANLPQGSWVVIPRIGVRTELRATQNPEEALQQGVWLAPDYSQPGDNSELPIILAAHRFGWEWWWQSDYWKYNSFYSLPEVEPGDLVEIIANQRKWTYEVYAGGEGQEITDYEADLILYTCKFLNSPLRHFRYARLVDLAQDTQV